MKCLVVSNHRLIRWSLVEFLEARGLEARSTPSRDLAAALLQERPVDLLIADPSEPGTSELLMRSQNLPRRPQIILLVDDTSVPPAIKPEQLGVLGVIEKPFLLDSLGRLLDSITDTRIGPAI
jgi:DNA-binding NtrC family response regulator